MNPQRGKPQGLRNEEKEQGWRFVECKWTFNCTQTC